MILTKRDREILRFVEEYGSITIDQCRKIFFKGNKYDYYQSRMRLKLLSDNNILKRYRADMRSEVVYYLEKRLSIHDLKVLDVYAELIQLDADIQYFKREYIIDAFKKQYRADALVEFVYNGYWYPLIIEIDYTHYTSEKKILDIYNSNYFQKKYKELDENIFPKILLVRPIIPKEKIKSDLFEVLYIDFELNGFEKVLE